MRFYVLSCASPSACVATVTPRVRIEDNFDELIALGGATARCSSSRHNKARLLERGMSEAMADSLAEQLRSPIMHSPSEEGLDYENVTFVTTDGVPLEGWLRVPDKR